jgi:hypothetical protein
MSREKNSAGFISALRMEQRKETYMKTIIRPTSIGTTVVFTALLVLGHHELPSTEPDMNVMLSQESEHVDQTMSAVYHYATVWQDSVAVGIDPKRS